MCPFLVTSRCLHPIPESILRCSRNIVLSTLMFIILCAGCFGCQTVSDRYQYSCVHSWSHHGVSIRLRCPSGGVHVTVFCRLMVIILCWWFGCQTVSDRYQFSCVHSWSHHCVSLRFPSGILFFLFSFGRFYVYFFYHFCRYSLFSLSQSTVLDAGVEAMCGTVEAEAARRLEASYPVGF